MNENRQVFCFLLSAFCFLFCYSYEYSRCIRLQHHVHFTAFAFQLSCAKAFDTVRTSGACPDNPQKLPTRPSPTCHCSRVHTTSMALVAVLHASLLSLGAPRVETRGMMCGTLPCLPGLDAMARGFDLAKGGSEDLLPIFDFVQQDAKEYGTYENPFNNSLRYMVPPSVRVTDSTAGHQAVKSTTFRTSHSYAQSLTDEAGAGGAFEGFTASVQYKKASSVLDSSREYGSFIASELKVSLYDVAVEPEDAPKTLQFTTALKTLTDTNNKAAYRSFFSRYGTHYISSATFGGKGTMTTSVNRAFANKTSTTDQSVQAGFHFSFLQAGGNASKATDRADSTFTAGSAFDTSMVGGDSRLILSDWSEWVKTFYSAPAQVNFKVKTIAELVTPLVPANVAAALLNESIAYVGAAAQKADTDAEIARLNRKVACFQAALEEDCCIFLTDGTTPSGAASCKCGETMDLRNYGMPKPGVCITKKSPDGRCHNVGYDQESPAPVDTIVVTDLDLCLAM
eukprot:COSAG03_NODE_613_length_6714_cov_4.286168_4_plen_510_part_00